MKNYKKVIAIIVSMAVLTGTASSCAVSKKRVSLSSDETISAPVDPVSLKELPRGEYEVYEADYLSGIDNITNITPLNNNRFLISSDTSGYGDVASQKLYIADDEKSTVTEITPDLDLSFLTITAFWYLERYSMTNTKTYCTNSKVSTLNDLSNCQGFTI